jgi:hypothetical protein
MGLKERKRLGRLAESHGLTVMPDPDMKRSYVMRNRDGWWSTAGREIINWSELRSTEVDWNDIEDRLIALSIITTFE